MPPITVTGRSRRMRAIGWMGGAALGAWLVVTAAAGGGAHPEALLGMLGPLVVAAATWVVTERTWRQAPERLTRVAITGFAVRAVLFGAYVVTMVRLLTLRPVPFVVSFVVGFVVVNTVEAVFLRRLLHTHVTT